MNVLISRLAPAAATALVLTGCASFSPDGGTDRVAALTKARTGQTPSFQRTARDVAAAEARIADLLKQPLTADRAVELAFLNNRGLQASFSELGIAEADLVRAGRLRNPAIGFGRLQEGGGVAEIQRSVLFDVLGLFTMPLASQRAATLISRTVARKPKSLALNSKTWMRCSGSNGLLGDFDCPAMEMPTPPK